MKDRQTQFDNPRKGKILYNIWLTDDEELKLILYFGKPLLYAQEIADIIINARNRNDFERR